jgi:hypothetical protein
MALVCDGRYKVYPTYVAKVMENGQEKQLRMRSQGRIRVNGKQVHMAHFICTVLLGPPPSKRHFEATLVPIPQWKPRPNRRVRVVRPQARAVLALGHTFEDGSVSMEEWRVFGRSNRWVLWISNIGRIKRTKPRTLAELVHSPRPEDGAQLHGGAFSWVEDNTWHRETIQTLVERAFPVASTKEGGEEEEKKEEEAVHTSNQGNDDAPLEIP